MQRLLSNVVTPCPAVQGEQWQLRSSGASTHAPHTWAIPGARAELAAHPFAPWMFMCSDFRIAAAGTSFDLTLMEAKVGEMKSSVLLQK